MPKADARIEVPLVRLTQTRRQTILLIGDHRRTRRAVVVRIDPLQAAGIERGQEVRSRLEAIQQYVVDNNRTLSVGAWALIVRIEVRLNSILVDKRR